MPRWNTISISGYHIREAGSDAVQEVAFTLADGIAYVEAARARGLAVDDFAPRISFFFNAHANLLEEVAKFRAARRLWARIMRERFGAQDPQLADAALPRADGGLDADGAAAAEQRRAHDDRGAGGRAGRRAVDPHQRLRRGAGAAHRGLGALALRTQQILAYESGVADVVDPLGGAYAIESLTSEIEARAAALLAEIDRRGGMVSAIEEGFPQREIERRAFEHQRAVEERRRIIVGQNQFADDRGRRRAPGRCTTWTRRSSRRRSNGLARFRSDARRRRAGNARRRCGETARGTENLLPASWRRSRRARRWERSPTCCEMSSGNIVPAKLVPCLWIAWRPR